MQLASQCPCIQKFVEPFVELAYKFSKSRALWTKFKKVQLEMLHWEDECSDNEGNAGFDGDEELSCGA